MALLPQDPAKQKKLLIGLLPLLLVFAYYQFMHTPQRAELDTMITRLEDLEAKNATARQLAQGGGAALQERLALYQANMERLEQLIPKREEVNQLLHSLGVQAQENNVALVAMTPRGEEAGTFYMRQTYSIGVSGSYHEIGAFLSSLGSLPRIISATDLRVAPLAAEAGSTEPPRLLAEFIAETYVVPEPGELVPDTTAAPGGA